MLTPAEFFEATQYFAIATLTMAIMTAIAFLFKWGFRFRLVGITGFLGVLTVGVFGLSFQPLLQTVVPGSLPYERVYDSGAAQIVIKVPDGITEQELEATLQQAAINLLKPSRLGIPGQKATIRARTLIHQEGGASKLVYLGQVQPADNPTPEQPLVITLNPDALAEVASAFRNDA